MEKAPRSESDSFSSTPMRVSLCLCVVWVVCVVNGEEREKVRKRES